MKYFIARFIVRFVMWLLTTQEIHGFENIDPQAKGMIVASNHIGRLEAAMVYILLNRSDVMVPVAEKYEKSPFWRFMVKSLNGIFIDRFHADMAAVRTCLNHIKKGGAVVIAPEGTRSPTASLQEGKPGVCYIAVKANAPIIPVGVSGCEDRAVRENFRHFRRTHLVVNIGKPFSLPPLDNRNREKALAENTNELMCQIGALLPPSYRGVYADQPRLHELIAQKELEHT